jgi:tetratricopeptide (TPR) repeat protein
VGKVALFVAVLLSLSSTAHAQDAIEAAKHFKRGSTLYYLQRYHEAAVEYEKAYEAKDAPDILFNIGQAYRLGGEYQKALGAYRSYLSLLPDVKNRAEVVSLIDNVKLKLQAQQAEAAAKRQEYGPQPEPPPAPPVVVVKPDVPPPALIAPPLPPLRMVDRHELAQGRKLRVAGLAVGAFGIAAVVVGGTFAGLTDGINHQLNHPPAGAPVYDKSLESRGHTDQTLETALFAVGGAAVVAGVATFLVGTHKVKRNRFAFAPALGAHQVGASLGFGF